MAKEKKILSEVEKAQIFVDQSKELRAHVEKKNMDVSKEFEFYRSQGFNEVGALDILMYSNAELRAGFNALPENKKNEGLRVAYDVTANLVDDSEYWDGVRKYERAAPLDTASNPGGANVIQTTLADTIVYKTEETGQVLALVAKDDIPYGDKEYPNMYAKVSGQFIDENSTSWTDIVASSFEDATNGLKKVKFTPRDFGLLASYTNRVLKKVSPRTVQFFRDYEAKALARGIDQQILRGAGSGAEAQGILGIATVINFNTNAYLTFLDGLSALATTDTENIKAVMHRKTWNEFKKLRLINLSYKDIIDPVNMKIDDIPVVLSNNSDSSVATSGNVILGDFDHYLYAKTGGLETIEDIYSAAATRKVNIYHTMLIDLGALRTDSFATYSITF